MAAGVGNDQRDPRNQLCAARRLRLSLAPRNEGGALFELANQSPGQRRGHRADQPGPARHDQPELSAGAARPERSMPAQLRAEAQVDDSGGPAGTAAGAGLDQRAVSRIPNQTGIAVISSSRPHLLASAPAP